MGMNVNLGSARNNEHVYRGARELASLLGFYSSVGESYPVNTLPKPRSKKSGHTGVAACT